MANENINIEKSFPTEVSELYKAWTEEDALKSWWKPAGRQLLNVDANLKEGGALRYTFEKSDNSEGELIIEGEYKTVVAEQQLIYSWNWKLENEPVENGSYNLTVIFKEDGDGSILSITQSSVGENEGIHPHQEGWEKALNDLEEYLSSNI